MASLYKNPKSGRYQLRFRYCGEPHKRALGTKDQREARGILGRAEETLRLLERGRLTLPEGADLAEFILSDGKQTEAPKQASALRLKALFERYKAELPKGAKEESTLYGEQIHFGHLLRHIKPRTVVESLSLGDLQRYVERRLKETWNNKPISPATVKKEITTFRLVWNWAKDYGLLSTNAPTRGIKFPKSDEKQPFMTWDEIERRIARGGLDDDDQASLWESLYLRKSEIEIVLELVRQAALHPFILPMFVFAAHTGARRSEILRSEIDDFDFSANCVRIREKKKSKEKAITFRHVPMTDLLRDTMSQWFSAHPGGQLTICFAATDPLTSSQARDHFKRTLSLSKWKRIKGFHVFRHSFASNLAGGGIDQRIIDEWMGHQTEEMRRRYRHLFPEQQQAAIDRVFGRVPSAA